MMCSRILVCFFFLLYLLSCNENQEEPCLQLQNFANKIKSDGWIPDAKRVEEIKNYPELEVDKISFFNQLPFYKIDFEHTEINNAFKHDLRESDLIDRNLFKSVNQIWGYFYITKKNSNLRSDGLIEQWEFTTKEETEEALKQITSVFKSNGGYIYFNTIPYFCSVDNYLIIFQTRAMAFSYDQKKLFEEFKEVIKK